MLSLLLPLLLLATPRPHPFIGSAPERPGSLLTRAFGDLHARGLAPGRIPVTVVVMDSFGDQRLLGAVRRIPGAPRLDLIVAKRAELTPPFLVALAGALRESVSSQGAAPTHRINIYFLKRRRWQTPSASELAWAQQVISALSLAAIRNLGTLGDQRAVDTELPQ